MNKLDKTYTDLLQDILDNGTPKSDRTGTGTISVFGRQIRHNMKDGFPLLTTKKMPFKTIVTELLWFLRGDTNIKYLVDNGCNIWNGDAYKNYLKWFDEQSKSLSEIGITREPWTKDTYIEQIKLGNVDADLSDLGPIYGAQWRSWKSPKLKFVKARSGPGMNVNIQIDQIQNLINDLKTNPDSRRLMVNAWNVGELDQMVLPPCHYGFQVYTRKLSYSERLELTPLSKFEKSLNPDIKIYNTPTRAISLMWNQRSVDTFLGLPFNIASYGLLLEIIAKEVNMAPDELIGNLGDVHLYSNHIDAAKEQIGRELTLNERKQIFEDKGHVCDVWPFSGDWSGEYDGFGIPKRTREPFPLPTLNINTEFWKTQSGECGVGPLDTNLQGFEISDFEIVNYQSHPTIKAPLSN